MGGAGTILKSEMTEEKEAAYLDALSTALQEGYEQLKKGKSALEAVESAIIALENCPLFNAGKGSVFNANGEHEMDASIMDGKSLNAGAITGVRLIKNPISLACKVLHHSDHILLMGAGAEEFARQFDLETVPAAYFFDQYRFDQWQKVKGSDSFHLDHAKSDKKYFGTVGAVALDQDGNLAAGTSTGGMTNKKFGRVGDSPIIGAGTYADNATCAISCTGSGEYIIRGVTAYEVAARIKFEKFSLDKAATLAIMESLTAIGGDGGLIGIDRKGNITMPFNCEGMYRAARNQHSTIIQIYR